MKINNYKYIVKSTAKCQNSTSLLKYFLNVNFRSAFED